MIDWIKALITQYGGINVLIMVAVIVITNLIKIPIKKHADKVTNAAKTLLGVDLDKSVITSNIIYIPIGVAFVLYFIYTLFTVKFQWADINWGDVVASSVIYGMLSISLFDAAKTKLNAYKSKDSYEKVKAELEQLENKTDGEKDLIIKE